MVNNPKPSGPEWQELQVLSPGAPVRSGGGPLENPLAVRASISVSRNVLMIAVKKIKPTSLTCLFLDITPPELKTISHDRR
jgi:hypothetical protein